MPKGIYKRSPCKQPPRTFKDNFWSKERVIKNLKLEEVADMLGYKRGKVSMWFSGQVMPDDEEVAEICKLFEVDFNEGQLAFQKAHLEWKAEHKNKTIKYSGKRKLDTTTDTVEKISSTAKVSNIAEVVLTLYGKISCEAFLTVYNAVTSGKPSDCDIEQLIYGKVDFKTYQQIITIMKS